MVSSWQGLSLGARSQEAGCHSGQGRVGAWRGGRPHGALLLHCMCVRRVQCFGSAARGWPLALLPPHPSQS